MLRAIGRRLTYANVIATLALFLALGGGAVWAASQAKVGAGMLKANAVTSAKIRANAVTEAKIRGGAVTKAKLKAGAVTFGKIAAGTDVVLTATSPALPVGGGSPITVGFDHTTSFTPVAGVVYLMSIEARSTNLARSGTEACRVTIVPIVNGSEWGSGAPLLLRAFEPGGEAPSGVVPAAGMTSPIGLTATGATQTVGARLLGSPACSSSSTATVAIAVTQAK
ncbi:MAG TPA: hypothetical protein VMH33_00555 [Solirubrobacterales bacterium]|nr:hypothetical protein [Solirubrobacterales bacterium]